MKRQRTNMLTLSPFRSNRKSVTPTILLLTADAELGLPVEGGVDTAELREGWMRYEIHS
jgi:hypothetical protein